MNVKNILKSVDFKGFAIQHCEKAAIVVATAVLVAFLVNGVKKAMSASDITPDQIAQLADKLTDSVRKSKWESSPDRETVKNPNLDEQIKELMTGIDSNKFTMSPPYYFNFVDFGGIMRQKPDILKPYNPIAVADKGALLLYKTDAKGNILMEEKVVRPAPKKKTPEKEDDPKKKKTAAPKTGMAGKGGKAGPGGMAGGAGGAGAPGMGMGMGGMGEGGDQMADNYGRGSMGGSRGMAMGPGMGMGMGGGMTDRGGGRGAGGRDDQESGSEGMIGGNIGASQVKKSGGIRRNITRQDDDDQFAGDEQPAKAGGAPLPGVKADPKVPLTRKVEVEEIRGIRWAVVTALYPHREQVKEYVKKLHADDPPVYKMVMVERREVQSDGSLSEWAPIDLKKEAEIVRVIPKKRRTPEWPGFIAAKALFEGLVMPLPELAIGKWTYHNQAAARDAALASGAQVGGGRGMVDGEMEGNEDESTQDQLNQELFGSGGAGVGRGVGAAGASGMGGGMPGGFPGGGAGGRAASQGATGAPGMGMTGRGQGAGVGAGGGVGQPAGGNQPGSQGAGTTKDQPKAAQRTNAEIVQIRFIDYTVEPEHTYQYRLKVVVENPNFNRVDILSDDVAEDETLTSKDWSEPTLPVYVPGDTEYYVLEKIKTREEAKLQVHRWLADLGDWQFSDFTIKPGDPIGSEVRDYPLVDFEDKLKKLPRFDFSTQDLLLDVTGGDKKFVFVVDGVEKTFNETLPAEIFVLDRLGDLVTRNEDFDKYNAERKERESQILTLRKEADKDTKKSPTTKTTESGGSEGFDERVPTRKPGG